MKKRRFKLYVFNFIPCGDWDWDLSVAFTAKLYGYSMFVLGVYYVVKTQNKIIRPDGCGLYKAEVLLRMTGGNISYEFSKYGVMLFILMGIYFAVLKGLLSLAFVIGS
jgi:hypothetical protein